MFASHRRKTVSAVCAVWFFAAAAGFAWNDAPSARAAKPTPAQALRLAPIQDGVEYDRPDAKAQENCTVEAYNEADGGGWAVRDGNGVLLRRFLDTNKDNKVDLWCYYRSGIEVYRDIDSDFNGKADQYRWLGTAGTRWGKDADEDGVIDSWKVISAEEVTAELVAALRDRDTPRFRALLLTGEELKSLGLGKEKQAEVAALLEKAAGSFASLAPRQQVVSSRSQWVHFGGTVPGLVPAGTEGSTRDVIVYENVAAVVETEGKHAQVPVGTLVNVGPAWRLIDLPGFLPEGTAAAAPGGFFFTASLSRRPDSVPEVDAGASKLMQERIAQLEKLEQQIAAAAGPRQQGPLYQQQADLLALLAKDATRPEEQLNWVHQLTDVLSAAAQTGAWPAALERLKEHASTLRKADPQGVNTSYAVFRYLSADYALSLQQPKADFAEIQKEWLANLEAFIDEFPKSSDAAEALLQLAIAQEFAGEASDAQTYYGRIVKDFPKTSLAVKAAGAIRRLDSVGKSLEFKATTADGRAFDLAAYRNKVVLLHYWATWCEPCKEDLAVIKQLQAKYGRQGFEPIGISLDNSRQELVGYLQQNRLPWPQLYEDGGLDSRLANELGILTLPAMLLIENGRVVNRSLHVSEVEEELKKRLR